MKVVGFLLVLLGCTQFAQADSCTKILGPGLIPFDPFSIVFYQPDPVIVVRSKGHTVEYVEEWPNFLVSVDGNPPERIDGGSARDAIQAACGSGFSLDVRHPAASLAHAVSSLSPTGQTSEDSVFADFNGDGIPDSAVLYGNGISVTLFGANGTKLATARYSVANISNTPNIVTADFNRDGVPDLAVATGVFPTSANPYPAGNVVVLLGNRDGTFGQPASFPVAAVNSSYLAAGDFNGDGVADLALAHSVSSTAGEIAVLLGKGDGTFNAPVGYPVGPRPLTVLAADFNGDGKLDIATLDAGSSNKVWVLPGRGNGTFLTAISSPSLSAEGHLAYADLNHDGKLDLITPDRLSSAMEVMMGNGDGSFRPGTQYLASEQPVSIAPIPLNDGTTLFYAPDNGYSGGVFLFFADNGGTVYSPTLQPLGQNPTAIAAADLNGDGKQDLVIADSDAGAIYVKLGTGNGQFAAPVSYAAGSQPGPIAIADLNGDGRPDVIAADVSGLDIFPGNGNGTLGTLQSAPSTTALQSISVADFNGDGKPDVASAAGSGGIALFLGNGNGTFQTARTVTLPNAQTASSADLNRDGKPDLVVATGPIDLKTPGTLGVLLGKGDGTFAVSASIPLPAPLMLNVVPAIADLNGDGKADVVLPLFNSGQTQLAVLLGNGDGTFQPPAITLSTTSTTVVTIADLNGDGKPDLVLGSCCGEVEATVLYGNGDGTFQAEIPFPSGPDPSGIVAADLNGDGLPDLAIVGHVEGSSNPARGTIAITFNASTSSGAGTATILSAANSPDPATAPGSLASIYGTHLATGTPGSTSLPLPTAFGGTSVSLVDSAGTAWQLPLLYVSPSQVNVLVPLGVANGAAQVTVSSGDGVKSTASAQIASVAPGLFALNAANLAAAVVIRISATGAQQLESVYSVNSAGAIVPSAVDLGSASDVAYLVLFGTGFRSVDASAVKVTVGGANAPVQFAGTQGEFAGLDQVNVLLPRSLAGSGDVTIQMSAAGIAANPVHLTIQ